MARELAFSVTMKDCRLDTFRCGGKGGQNVNTGYTESCASTSYP